MRKFFKNPYNWFISIVLAINILPILAPILMKLSEQPGLRWLEAPARGIYLVYSFSCHQFHHRSLHIYDHQCAWCSRDMGIWSGILTAAIASRTGQTKPLAWYWTLPFVVPIALDGGIQTVATVVNMDDEGAVDDPVYISNNFMRFLTGAIFGIGVGFFIAPRLRELMWKEVKAQSTEQLSRWRQKLVNIGTKVWTFFSQSKLILAPSLVALLILIYIGLVGIWQLTSTNYQPTDFLDSTSKAPQGTLFIRRKNAVCPVDSQDSNLFQVQCFFE